MHFHQVTLDPAFYVQLFSTIVNRKIKCLKSYGMLTHNCSWTLIF